MRGLANAAVEGLLVCDGETIVTANESFAALTGLHKGHIIGTALSSFLPQEAVRVLLASRDGDDNGLIEATLRQMNEGAIPVELVARSVVFAGRTHRAIAVRDLRMRKTAEAELKHLADHDALTGLPSAQFQQEA